MKNTNIFDLIFEYFFGILFGAIFFFFIAYLVFAPIYKATTKSDEIEKIMIVKAKEITVHDLKDIPHPQNIEIPNNEEMFERLEIEGYPVLSQKDGEEMRLMTNKGVLVIFQE